MLKTLFAAFVGLIVSTSASASLIYAGTNVGGDFWNRPIGAGPSISGLGPVRYSVQGIVTDLSGLYTFDSTQDYDGYLHVYAGSFDPVAQLTNLLAGDDDGPGGIGTSQILDLALTAGTTYLVVTSAFAAGDEGIFENTISTNLQGANIRLVGDSPVPVPATLALLGLGLLGLRLSRKV